MTNVNNIRDEMSREYIIDRSIPNIDTPILKPLRIWETSKTARNRRKKENRKLRKRQAKQSPPAKPRENLVKIKVSRKQEIKKKSARK